MAESRNPGAVSSALLANLEETRREVVVPVEYEPLLAAVEQYFGVRQTVERLLTEFFHPYRNLGEIAKLLKNLCGSMFHYFERGSDPGFAGAKLNSLFSELYDDGLEPGMLQEIVGTHIQLLITLNQSTHRPAFETELAGIASRLVEVQQDGGGAFLPFSRLIQRIGETKDLGGKSLDSLAQLYRGVVKRALNVFAETVDLETWNSKIADDDREDASAAVVEPVLRTLVEVEDRLARAEEAAQVFSLPNIDDLLNFTLGQASTLSHPVPRISLLVHLAGVPELRYRNMEILRTLYFSIKVACDEGDETAILRAVDLITAHLAACPTENMHLLYKCLEKLGRGIARRKNHRITDYFVERTIQTGFEGPDIAGVSEEWEVWVNPHHLPCLRTWLAIIESDPIQFEKLLSALVVNLYFNGVFVSDTDLFQRDISTLLNSGIGDAFNLIMQLVTFFPVFFNEVGSEGELRDISTRIDQICHRRDPVIHFLRKQSHAESNNRLIGFAKNVYSYWRTADGRPLQPYLPESTFVSLDSSRDWFTGVHRLAAGLDEEFGFTEKDLDGVNLEQLQGWIESIDEVSAVDRERLFLLVKLYRLLKAKYAYSVDQVIPLLEGSTLISGALREEFVLACRARDHLQIVRIGNRILAALKRQILSSEVTEPFEDIFLKRHIAAGIPSMYGTYREPKFDSMGLLLRLMAFLKPHLEACVSDFNFRYMTRETIREAHAIMEQMLEGLRLAGLRVQHLSTKLDILSRGIALGKLTASQYLNIFDFMADALSDVVQTNYISLHNTMLAEITRRRAEEHEDDGEAQKESVERESEGFLRSIISSTYAIQEFDLFLRRVRRTLASMTDALDDYSCDAVLSYSPRRLISFIHEPLAAHEDQLFIGYKGYALKRLKVLELPVPDGFVVSTELFNLQEALSFVDLRTDARERILEAVRQVEARTGSQLGGGDTPLLLSVRSGSAFSMPGMMDTILNVGLNPDTVEGLAERMGSSWGAWDCYRRYVQNVAMSCGSDRDLFDDTMVRYKERYGVALKSQFTAEQMQEMALEYRRLAIENKVALLDDAEDQLVQAVFLVLRSWESAPARVYRHQLQLSDNWGTGVIVQQMVFGNLGESSGSGVVFTRNPRASSTGITLFGDFTVCSQGEDVVAGLVHPFPVSEKQRLEYMPHVFTSLEVAAPGVFGRLQEVAEQLINEHGYEHQEIEFTFESDRPEDLYLLQVRPMRLQRQQDMPVFSSGEALEESMLATGIGVSGGAMWGRIAFNESDIADLKQQYPNDKLILLRPDTVPEDINMVLAVDGLLTARGGFTSHAAVTAKKLGKCCVVNCTQLVISEDEKSAHVGNRSFAAGDLLSIDGSRGPVYEGKHEVTRSRSAIRMP